MLILYLIFVFGFSLEFSFAIDIEEEFPFTYYLKIFSLFFFSMNVFTKLNTDYFEYGMCVKERKKIIINYAKNMLLWDLISLSSLSMSFFEGNFIYFFKLFFLLTYFNIRKLFHNLKEQKMTNDTMEIFLLLFRLICISHFIACIWHAIAYYNVILDPNHWLDNYNTDNWQKRYIASLYWAITTLCTVGYGDITPKNYLEMSYCSFVMLMGTLIFGYSINSIGLLINRIDQRGKEFREKMAIIDNFMNKGNFNEDLRTKVKNYLQYIWKSEDKNLEKAEEIIMNLPSNMRKEILLESVGKIINNTSFLKNNFSKEFLNHISLNVKPFSYSPCDIIYSVIL